MPGMAQVVVKSHSTLEYYPIRRHTENYIPGVDNCLFLQCASMQVTM